MFDTCCVSRVAPRILHRVALEFCVFGERVSDRVSCERKTCSCPLSQKFIGLTHTLFPPSPLSLSSSLCLSLTEKQSLVARRRVTLNCFHFLFFVFFYTSCDFVNFYIILNIFLHIILSFANENLMYSKYTALRERDMVVAILYSIITKVTVHCVRGEIPEK